MMLPNIHDVIALESVKHDGSLHRRWEKNTILYRDQHVIIGYNDRTLVTEPSKPLWKTDLPALFYFDQRYWFNIVFILAEQPFYYCNLSSPFTYDDRVLQYIDYDLDVIAQVDGSYKVVDEDEYEANSRYYKYPQIVQDKIAAHMKILLEWILAGKGPFQEEQRHHYYELFRNK